MRQKIYDNREVLRGLTLNVPLGYDNYQFKIIYVNQTGVKITISLKYSEIASATSDSLPGIVREMIYDTNSNLHVPISRRAEVSRFKLKKSKIIIDSNEFEFDLITASQIKIVKIITYDELLNANANDFITSIRTVIDDNLMENPPIVKKPYNSGYGWWSDVPYLFNDWGTSMNFTQLRGRRAVVSDERLERNREKFKKQHEKEKENREKMRKLEEEINLNRPSRTRDLARFR